MEKDIKSTYLGKGIDVYHNPFKRNSFPFNDNMGTSDSHLIPYCGNFDVKGIMSALNLIEFSGYFTFESDSSARLNDAWSGPDNLDILSEKNITQLTNDRLGQEKLLYQLGEELLSS